MAIANKEIVGSIQLVAWLAQKAQASSKLDTGIDGSSCSPMSRSISDL